MGAKLFILVCAATLIVLAGATPAAAGELSFGFSFGCSGYPGYGYGFGFGYSRYPGYGYGGYYPAAPPYVYRAYGPPVLYPVPVVRPYYYAPYGHRVAPAYRPCHAKPHKGKYHGAYVPRRYYRH